MPLSITTILLSVCLVSINTINAFEIWASKINIKIYLSWLGITPTNCTFLPQKIKFHLVIHIRGHKLQPLAEFVLMIHSIWQYSIFTSDLSSSTWNMYSPVHSSPHYLIYFTHFCAFDLAISDLSKCLK